MTSGCDGGGGSSSNSSISTSSSNIISVNILGITFLLEIMFMNY
jgi:hypothetical protein